jgi:hypothetical protein
LRAENGTRGRIWLLPTRIRPSRHHIQSTSTSAAHRRSGFGAGFGEEGVRRSEEGVCGRRGGWWICSPQMGVRRRRRHWRQR